VIGKVKSRRETLLYARRSVELMPITEEVLRSARAIWQFLQLGHKSIPGDVIIAFGTNDLRVAQFAADLYHRGFGPLLVCTGGIAHQNDLLGTSWGRSEAEMYAQVAQQCGVPSDCILLEPDATNTAENIRFTRLLLEQRGIRPDSVVLAVKPFMQRRVWATMVVEWPEMPATLASASMTLDEYFTEELTPERIINIMLGDLQRIWIYGRRGWAAPQRVPENVLSAYSHLKELGFTRQLLPED
jgi:uncharacterized SAM-binding protein YcdF (DUF218 family)